MKVKLIIVSVIVGVMTSVDAQEPVLSPAETGVKITGIRDYVPAKFATENQCKLTFRDFNNDTGNVNLKCVDNSLSTVADINIAAGENNYSKYAESGNAKATVSWDSVAREVVASSPFSSSVEEKLLQLTGYNFQFSYQYINDGVSDGEVYTSDEISFTYDEKWDFRIPSFFFIYNGNELTQVRCEGNYSVEVDLNTDYVPAKIYSNPLVSPIYYDYDNDVRSLGEVSLTQTLFNSDSDFEYILPVYADKTSSKSFTAQGYLNYNSENSFTFDGFGYMNERCGCITGFNIVREDGTLIQSVSFGEEFKLDVGYSDLNFISIVEFGSKRYLSCNLGQETILYEIKSSGNGVEKIASFKTRVYPSVVNRSESVNVEYGENAREIFINDLMGRNVYSGKVDTSRSGISIPASGLSEGINVVTVTGKGKANSAKIIVK